MIPAALILCLLLSFFLSGLESALLSVSGVRVRHRAKEAGRPRGKEARLERIFRHRQRLLTSVLLTNNALALVAFALATRILVGLFGGAGYWIAFVVSLPVYVFWCELVPKSLFARLPYRTLRASVGLLEIIDMTVGQLLKALVLLQPVFNEEADAPDGGAEEGVSQARREFRSLTEITEREGALAPREREMIENVMNFRQISVGQMMVPLAEVTAVPLEMPAAHVIKLARETGLEEFPVMSKSGDLIGIVSAFEMLRDPKADGNRAVNYLHRLVKVASGERASSIVPRLRKTGLRVAAVCSDDPARRPLGIVSIDDILQRMLHTPHPEPQP